MYRDNDGFNLDGGNVVLNREGWLAVMNALDGDDSSRDAALDALQRRAPENWLAALDDYV